MTTEEFIGKVDSYYALVSDNQLSLDDAEDSILDCINAVPDSEQEECRDYHATRFAEISRLEAINEIVRSNVSMAMDQRHEYDAQEDSVCQWYEGDDYLQNTIEAIRENGYCSDSDWENARELFCKLAADTGLRFAS